MRPLAKIIPCVGFAATMALAVLATQPVQAQSADMSFFVTSNGIGIEIARGEPAGDVVFHVAVPAHRWWEDIAST